MPARVIALITVVGFLCTPLFALAQSQESGTLVVTVTDVQSKKPIDNADVFVLGGDQPQNSLTNAKGLLIFDGLQPALYHIKVEAEDYQSSESTDVEVGEGQRVDVAVTLSPQRPLRTIANVVAQKSTTSVSVERVDQQSAQWKVSDSLNDALSKIAGVNADTNEYGGDSAFNISLRGSSASSTSYSINGMHVGGGMSSAIGGFQDLFSGGSVDFAPSAYSTSGNVNFFTIQPTKMWTYSLSGLLGNYSKTSGSFSVTGGSGKAAFAFQHTSGGYDSPLSGLYYADQSGQSYLHQGGFSRIADLLKASFTLSKVSSVKYALMTGVNRSSYICAEWTTLLPCSAGPGNWSYGSNTLSTLTFSSLAGHIQYDAGVTQWNNRFSSAEPNLSINGVSAPGYQSGSFPSLILYVDARSTARRHTLSTDVYEDNATSTNTSSFNSTQAISNSQIQRSGAISLTDEVKSNDKLALRYSLSQASGTGAGSALELYSTATWQPKKNDVFQAGLGAGSAQPAWGAGTIGDAVSGSYDCSNGSVYIDGPSDEAVKQSSLQYNVDWRHTLKGGFFSVSLYRRALDGQNIRAGVPFGAEPGALFPGGPATYLASIEDVWSQPTVCGSKPFNPSHVYVTQSISGVGQIQQGVDVSAQFPLGHNVIALPRYAVTNSYISTLDPRLIAPGSYYAVGAQLPHVPLHTAGIIIDGHLTHSAMEWLVDAEYTAVNNGNNLPAHVLYNAGWLFNTPNGSIRLLEANIFGTGTGLFATYQGVNPMPLQNGGSFALSTTPLPPRSFTVQYQVKWHEHQAPPSPGH